MAITRGTPWSIAASMTFVTPMTLVWIASKGLYSQEGICLRAAAWITTSTPCIARSSRSLSRTSPTKKRRLGSLKRPIISDCLSSSRLNTTRRRGWYFSSMISTNLLPNEPVPPVTRTDASAQFTTPWTPPTVAHHRVVAVRELHDEVVRVGHAGGAHDLGLGHVVATVGDVVADRRVEQQRLLGDDAEESAIGVLPQRPEVAPVDGDHAGGGIVQAQHEVDQRRLADAARPHHRHHLALADVEGHPPEHRLAVAVAEGDVAQRDAVAERADRLRADGHGRPLGEQLVHPAGGRQNPLHGRVGSRQEADLDHDGAAHIKEEEERRRGETSGQGLPRRQEDQH